MRDYTAHLQNDDRQLLIDILQAGLEVMAEEHEFLKGVLAEDLLDGHDERVRLSEAMQLARDTQ